MQPLFWFWAKLGNKTWPEEYHPVICHLIDVGQVARKLRDEVFRPKVRQWVGARHGLTDQSEAGVWGAAGAEVQLRPPSGQETAQGDQHESAGRSTASPGQQLARSHEVGYA